MPYDSYNRHYDEFRSDRPGSGRWPRCSTHIRQLCSRTVYSGGMGNALRCADAVEHADIAWLERNAKWWDPVQDTWRTDFRWVLPVRVKVKRNQPKKRGRR